MAMNLLPKQNEDVLAIFDGDFDSQRIVRDAQTVGLNIVSFDERFGHLIVHDVNGGSVQALYEIGASFVVDADFAALCSEPSELNRSEVL